MVATDFEKRFARARENYFDEVLKRGTNDPIKRLIKVIKEKESSNNLSTKSITRIIQESYNELGKNGDAKSKAVVQAAGKLTGRSKFDSYQEEDFKKDVAKALKDYAFINDTLENIPNAGKDALTAITSTFTGYTSDDLKDDALKAGIAYAKIVSTVCGTGPFVDTADLPEKDPHSHHVKNCLDQSNKIAYILLQDMNCGSDKLDCFKVKESCYYAITDRLYDLYNRGNVDMMRIDLMGEYPCDQVFPDLPKIKKEIAEYEVSECLRAKKKQAEEAVEKLVEAYDVMEDVDPEAIKYNTEVLDKIVDKIKEKKKIEVLDDDKKKEIDDWLVYAKKQMEEKDKEIELLKTELEKTKLINDSEKLTEIKSPVQQYHHEDL